MESEEIIIKVSLHWTNIALVTNREKAKDARIQNSGFMKHQEQGATRQKKQ